MSDGSTASSVPAPDATREQRVAPRIPREEWQWFGHAGHLIVARWCRFHLTTKIGGYLVSTVGEYWPERPVREIHASVHDAKWLATNKQLRGDAFDAAYMKRFGFEEIGCERTYETMVFEAGQPCSAKGCGCGLPEIDGSELDFAGYNAPADATLGHYAMCEKYAALAATPAEAPAPHE